jgi:uroporphyrinogen-III synthase
MAVMQASAKVALFRAREDAAESAGKLRELGFEAVLLPVIETRPLPFALAHPRYDALLATSAKAFLAEARVDRDAPFYCVGERTARAAEAAGWRPAAPPAPDAATLAALVRERVPAGASLLYLAGRDRKSALEEALQGLYALEVAEAYAAEARDGFSEAESVALAGCRAALHYSRRSAGLAAALATRSGAGEAFLRLAHVCLSRDAAEPLEAMRLSVRIAEAPNETALFAALRGALGRVSFG